MRLGLILLSALLPGAVQALEPPAVACDDADGTTYLIPVLERDGTHFAWFTKPGLGTFYHNFVVLDCSNRDILFSRYPETAPNPGRISTWVAKRMADRGTPFTVTKLQPAFARRNIPTASGKAASPLPCFCGLPRN